MTDIGFIKSSFSTGNGGECVEWAHTADGVYVRDSKDRDGAELFFTSAEWDDLVAKAAGAAPSAGGVHLTGRGGKLLFTAAEWDAFAAAARAGECHPVPAAAP
jgi:Domain of unknown function (DUF397)